MTTPLNPIAPGVYTNPSGGIGYAAVVDTNSAQIVTPSTPAQPGDTIEVFATGLGAAFPRCLTAPPRPISPLSPTVGTIQADVDGTTATVGFAGLAPTLAGLYQINVTIPSTTTAGDHALNISGINPTTQKLETYAAQVLIPVAGGTAAARSTGASARVRHRLTSARYPQRNPLPQRQIKGAPAVAPQLRSHALPAK